MYPEHAQLAGLGVQHRSTGESTGPTTSYEYYFHFTPTGLVRFESALDCGGASRVKLGNPDAWPLTGVTEGCQFDANSSHFTVIMKFDFDHYRMKLAPEHVGSLLATTPQKDRTKLRELPACSVLDQLNMALRKGDATEILWVWTWFVQPDQWS